MTTRNWKVSLISLIAFLILLAFTYNLSCKKFPQEAPTNTVISTSVN